MQVARLPAAAFLVACCLVSAACASDRAKPPAGATPLKQLVDVFMDSFIKGPDISGVLALENELIVVGFHGAAPDFNSDQTGILSVGPERVTRVHLQRDLMMRLPICVARLGEGVVVMGDLQPDSPANRLSTYVAYRAKAGGPWTVNEPPGDPGKASFGCVETAHRVISLGYQRRTTDYHQALLFVEAGPNPTGAWVPLRTSAGDFTDGELIALHSQGATVWAVGHLGMQPITSAFFATLDMSSRTLRITPVADPRIPMTLLNSIEWIDGRLVAFGLVDGLAGQSHSKLWRVQFDVAGKVLRSDIATAAMPAVYNRCSVLVPGRGLFVLGSFGGDAKNRDWKSAVQAWPLDAEQFVGTAHALDGLLEVHCKRVGSETLLYGMNDYDSATPETPWRPWLKVLDDNDLPPP